MWKYAGVSMNLSNTILSLQKHLQRNDNTHVFNWKILQSAPIKSRERKNLEAFHIAIKKPTLNNQLETKQLNLFRNGIT